MINSQRKSGINIIGDVYWGTHLCQFYHTKEDLIDILVPYFKAGLENNEFCLWVTSHPFEIEDAIQAMSRVVPDFNVYLEREQIEINSYKDWFFTEGIFNPERVLNSWVKRLTYTSNNGYEGLRFSVNASWLEKEDLNSFFKYKEQSDNIIGNYRIIALCTYSQDRHSFDELIQLGANHQFTLVKSEGKWKHAESPKRKIAEEAAVRARKDWENTFDAVPDLIAIIDTNFKIVRANRALSLKLGKTPEECIGLTCYRVVHETSNPPSFCPHKEMLTDGLEHTSEVCEECLGGYFIVSVSPQYDSEGKLTGSIHVARNINERRQIEEALRQSEEKFRNLIETANEGIHIIDAEHRNTYVNAKMAEMLGYSREDLVGKSVRDFTDDEGKAVFEMNMKKRRQGISESHEFRYIRKDGTLLWVHVNSKSLFDKDGKFAGSISMLTDITMRKEAEAKLKETLDNMENLVKERTTELETAYKSLKESESSLAEAQRMAHIGNWSWNLINGEMYWSDETYHIFGWTPQKTLSYNEVLTCTHPSDRENVVYAVKRALTGESFAIDHRLVLNDGEERIVHVQGEVVFNEKNIPIRMKGTVQDITELKKSEEKIKNLANIVESSNDAIGTISLDSIITSWNKGAEQVYGYSAEEILGKPSSIMAPPHLRQETKELIERIKQGESIHHYETMRLRKDGKIINVSRTLSPIFDSQGKITAISFISRDISERKKSEEKLRESEEKYRNIVETANEGIVKTDNRSIINYVNKKMLDMLGYSLEETIDRPIWGFISNEYKPIIKLNLKNKKQGLSESGDLKLICKDGSHIWVHMNSKPIFDSEGKYMGAVSMLTDITKRKEAEEALANVEISRQKEIHHRIKNNLQVISSLLDLQADKFRNKKSIKNSEVLEAFKESQDRVISIALIHEELHRGEGHDKLNFSQYIEELSENLFNTYSLGKENIVRALNLEDNVFFDMDIAVPLGMIINELVSNSLKHAFSGRNDGEVQIKLHKEENEGYFNSLTEVCKRTNFTLTVSDNGIGIPEDVYIEELDSLGLQLVTSLVDQIDGKLELKRDNGTAFIIKFKVRENNTVQVLAPQLVDNE